MIQNLKEKRLTLTGVGIRVSPRTPLGSIEPSLTAVAVCSLCVVLTHAPRVYLHNQNTKPFTSSHDTTKHSVKCLMDLS